MRKLKNKYFLILLSIMLVVFFLIYTTLSIFLENKEIYIKKEGSKEFAIIPHFMIEPQKVDDFYSIISKKYSSKIDKIVLISPNHFGLGINDYLSIKDKTNVCYNDNCIKLYSLVDNKFIFPGKGDEKIFNTDNLFREEYGKIITKEHGIGEHFKYLNKFFPEKEVFPLVIKPRKFSDIEKLINHLNNLFEKDNVLFLASVDFSHYIEEKYAFIHDKKTFYTLNNSQDIKQYKNIEVDCPNCLYLLNSIAYKNNKFPINHYRDSSSTITGEDQKYNNTSRMFIYYENQKKEDNGITIAYYGDLIYDRDVSKFLDTKQDFYNHFSSYFNLGDTKKDLNYYHHRKMFGLDFVGFNLETPVVENKNFCEKSSKQVNFCSLNSFLPWIKELGFNIVNLANNHSMDGGIKSHKNTIKNLEQNGLKYSGYIKYGNFFENNYIHTGSIRGIDYAWHSFDFTITKIMTDKYCNILKDYKSKGYNNFISVHWGLEYQEKHNITQENYAKELIDCGADLIIGHHPHVIQDIGEYKGKKIIYSLGNFLFDQGFSDKTKKGMEILIDYNINGETKIFTGSINAYVK